MQARCYPFNMPKRRFHNMNPQEYYHNLLYHSYIIVKVQCSKGNGGPVRRGIPADKKDYPWYIYGSPKI